MWARAVRAGIFSPQILNKMKATAESLKGGLEHGSFFKKEKNEKAQKIMNHRKG